MGRKSVKGVEIKEVELKLSLFEKYILLHIQCL